MTTTLAYEEFIKAKADFTYAHGFDVDDTEIHPTLFPHQRDCVRWAVQRGRAALFQKFGLGKTVQQLETLRLTLKHHGAGRALIVAPLGVRQEFIRDGQRIGVEVRFIRRIEDAEPGGIHITNYETVRDGKLNPNHFTAVSLDEASVLRSFGSKTYQSFLSSFHDVEYRFVATATPSPNRHKELIHYAGFLGIMDTGQALTRFFQRNSEKANELTLYPHKEQEFWMWLNSWSIFLQSPADLGHDATGYDLPGLGVNWHEVPVDHHQGQYERDGQGLIFRGGNLSLQQQAREKRDSMPVRLAKLMDIVCDHQASNPGDQIILWCTLNDEQTAIEQSLRAEGVTYSSVHGSLSVEETERRIEQWRNRETVALIGKPIMLGQGLNLQQCNTAVYIGVDDRFNDIIQSVHRIHRFGQARDCVVHLIYAESETSVKERLQNKWAQHEELTEQMTEIIREHGLNQADINTALTRSLGVDRIEASGDGWLVANNDCVAETKAMDDDSVDLIVTSIPFSNHYEYTPSYLDFGHTDDNPHFWSQMDYLTPELHRVLKPGRIYACHVKDRILFGNTTGKGVPTVSPFHAEALFHGTKHGFDYLGMITNVTDVVRENNQTYRLGYTEMRKDGSKMGAGSPEYILLFHKPQTDRTRGYADDPIVKGILDYSLARWQVDAHAFWRSSGNRHLTTNELAELPVKELARYFTEQTLNYIYDYESHIQIGEELQGKGRLPSSFMSLAPGSWHPDVWTDVQQMRNLNGEQRQKNLQQHVCPLPFDIVDRLIDRYSMPDELVFDPFGGLQTVPVRAIAKGRRGRGVELNTGYFLDGVKYLEAEERKQAMPTLFDVLGEVDEAHQITAA